MKPRSVIAAFSLLELLVVVAIMAILMALTLPAMNSALQGARLTQGTQIVYDQLSLARQTAISKNRVVEVRLYRLADPTDASKKAFRAVQSFELQDDGTARPIEKVRLLPTGIVIDSSASLSPLMTRDKQWIAPDVKPPVSGAGTDYQASALRLRPDGTTDLPPGQSWFATLRYENLGESISALPPNFSMIQIDPWTSQTQVYRP